jgi:uncharacterized membrane protein
LRKGRLEAFSDGVIAILITIMVLELRPPHAVAWESLRSVLPVFCSYTLSFIFLAIYWNNHHHMLQGAAKVNGAVLWANMHLLFWLSLVPFVTAWLGGNELSTVTTASYGFVFLCSGIAYYILTRALIAANGKDSVLAQALGRDFKGKISVLIYALGIGLAFLYPPASCGLYVAVALIWLVPDRRFENLPIDESP